MAEEVLIGFLHISRSHMHDHTFFRPLVLPLALHFYPPPDCHFCWREIFLLDLSFLTFVFLSGRHLHFFCWTEAESRNTKLALGGFFSQPTTLPPLLEADVYVGFVICNFRISVWQTSAFLLPD